MVNLSFESGIFPDALKEALVHPLLKKILLDMELFQTCRPMSNLAFFSKVIEKVAAIMDVYDLLEVLQNAYKELHSIETALVWVHNDIMRAIDYEKSDSVFRVLLALSSYH